MRPTYFTPSSDRLGSFGTPIMLCLNKRNSTLQSRCIVSCSVICNETCLCMSAVFILQALITQNNIVTWRNCKTTVKRDQAKLVVHSFELLTQFVNAWAKFKSNRLCHELAISSHCTQLAACCAADRRDDCMTYTYERPSCQHHVGTSGNENVLTSPWCW